MTAVELLHVVVGLTMVAHSGVRPRRHGDRRGHRAPPERVLLPALLAA